MAQWKVQTALGSNCIKHIFAEHAQNEQEM